MLCKLVNATALNGPLWLCTRMHTHARNRIGTQTCSVSALAGNGPGCTEGSGTGAWHTIVAPGTVTKVTASLQTWRVWPVSSACALFGGHGACPNSCFVRVACVSGMEFAHVMHALLLHPMKRCTRLAFAQPWPLRGVPPVLVIAHREQLRRANDRDPPHRHCGGERLRCMRTALPTIATVAKNTH